MTNEEKAREIQRNDVCCVWNGGCPNVKYAALEMAEWKDEQIRQYLNDCIDKAIAVNSPDLVKLFNKMKSDLNL